MRENCKKQTQQLLLFMCCLQMSSKHILQIYHCTRTQRRLLSGRLLFLVTYS